jgi:hypothetical protein
MLPRLPIRVPSLQPSVTIFLEEEAPGAREKERANYDVVQAKEDYHHGLPWNLLHLSGAHLQAAILLALPATNQPNDG